MSECQQPELAIKSLVIGHCKDEGPGRRGSRQQHDPGWQRSFPTRTGNRKVSLAPIGGHRA